MPQSNPTQKNDESAVFGQSLSAAILVLVVLVGAYAMSPSVADPDLWGHVQFGRDTLANGVAESTSYSFTAAGFRWINHENLSEVTMAMLVDQFGPAGLLWIKFAISLLVLGAIVWFNVRQGVSLITSSILTLLVAWNLGYHWSFRPQISSYFLFTVLILLLQFCFSDWRDQWHLRLKSIRLFMPEHSSNIAQSWWQGKLLWLIVPIILLWANSHGGFVAGVCITIAYLGLRSFEAIQVHQHQGWGYVRRFALISVAVIAATFINPYSFRLPLWLIHALGDPRPEIVDWSNGQLWSFVGLKFWVLAIVFISSILYTKRKLDFVHCCLLLITLWQSVSHFRHVPFFTILCGFWLGPHLESAIHRMNSQSRAVGEQVKNLWQRSFAYGFTLVAIIIISVQLSNRLDEIEVDRSVYPVDAISFLKNHEIDGKIVVTYNWAQYTIGALCSGEHNGKSTVAFDGRFRTCYPQEIVDMHFDFLYGVQDVIPRFRSPNSPEIDPNRVLQFGQPDLVLNKRIDEVTSNHMKVNDQWTLLYQDGLAQVWGKKSRFDDPKSPDFVPFFARKLSDQMPKGIVAWPAIPMPRSDHQLVRFTHDSQVSNHRK